MPTALGQQTSVCGPHLAPLLEVALGHLERAEPHEAPSRRAVGASRKWIVGLHRGTPTGSSTREKTAGGHESVTAASSTWSTGSSSAVRIQLLVWAVDLEVNGSSRLWTVSKRRRNGMSGAPTAGSGRGGSSSGSGTSGAWWSCTRGRDGRIRVRRWPGRNPARPAPAEPTGSTGLDRPVRRDRHLAGPGGGRSQAVQRQRSWRGRRPPPRASPAARSPRGTRRSGPARSTTPVDRCRIAPGSERTTAVSVTSESRRATYRRVLCAPCRWR